MSNKRWLYDQRLEFDPLPLLQRPTWTKHRAIDGSVEKQAAQTLSDDLAFRIQISPKNALLGPTDLLSRYRTFV